MFSVETVSNWKKVVNGYRTPIDDIERARFQFDCLYMARLAKNEETRWNLFIWNVKAFWGTPLLLIIFLINNFKTIEKKHAKAVFTCPDKRYSFVYNDLPCGLLERYGIPELVDEKLLQGKGVYANRLDKDAVILFFKTIFRYPFKFFMNLGLLVKLSRYCTIVKLFNPEALIVLQVERYYTTSILTRYCEIKGIKHICIQHGDYFYDPSSAFFRVSEYYVWNEETVKLFDMVRADLGSTYYYLPKRLKPSLTRNDHPQYFITYYLQCNNLDSLIRISNALSRFVKAGYPCCVRQHPRFALPKEFTTLFNEAGVIIEPLDKVTFDESICNTEYVVAHFSTVLTEAIINGFNAVIDDYTESIEILKEMCYINISKTPLRLSSLIRETGV